MSHAPGSHVNHDAAWQVSYLKREKGLSFNLVSEEEAAAFLEDMTFFFKLKSFAKNYEKRFANGPDQGKYINLDFGYLVELSRLDVHVRATALSLSLDIEHYLKVRINKAAMAHDVNPCALTENYLSYVSQVICSEMCSSCEGEKSSRAIRVASQALEKAGKAASPAEVVNEVNGAIDALDVITCGRRPDFILNSLSARSASSYSHDLVGKYDSKQMPYWAFMELISFGPLIRLYKFCFKKHGYIPDEEEAYVAKRSQNLLRNTQNLRNAAAHGDCLMNGLNKRSKSASRSGVKREIIDYGLSSELVLPVGSVPLAMDFAALLLCYDMIVSSNRSKETAAGVLLALSERMKQNRVWFVKNQPINSFLEYMDALLGLFANRWSAAI